MGQLIDYLDEIIQAIDRNQLAVFVGAGFSVHSGLPLVYQLVPKLLAELPLTAPHREAIQSATLPFEVLLDTLARGTDTGPLFAMFREGRPHKSHLLLARLVRRGKLSTIATTNFDLLVERAFAAEGLAKGSDYEISLSAAPKSSIKRLKARTVLYKLHGTADDPASLIATIKQVARRFFSEAQQRILQRIFVDGTYTTVLVLGYSCSDIFDIVPQIAALGGSKKRVYLVEHKQGVSACRAYPLRFPFDTYHGMALQVDGDLVVSAIWDRVLRETPPVLPRPAFTWEAYVSQWGQGSTYPSKAFTAGELLRQIGNYSAAIGALREAVTMARSVGDRANERRSYGALGTCFRALGEYADALGAYRKGLNIANKDGVEAERSRFLGDIGSVYRNRGEYDRALRAQRQSLRAAQKCADDALLAAAHANLGNTLHMVGKHRAAARHHLKAVQGAEKVGDKRLEGLSLGNLGAMLLILGKIEQSAEVLERSVRIAELVGDKRTLAANLGNLGTICDQRGDTEKAIDFFERGLDIAARSGIKELQCSLGTNLAGVLGAFGRFDRAVKVASEALKLAKQIGDPRCQVRAIANMGLALLRSNHRSKAKARLKAGLICARRIGDKRGEALVLRNLAEFHWQSHDFPMARRFARRSLVISEECGDMWYQARALYWLARSRRRISRELLSRALVSYTKIGAADHPEAKEIAQYIHGGEPEENLPQKPHNISRADGPQASRRSLQALSL